MIIYNITLSIDKDITQECIKWLKTNHIPKVLNTRLMQGYQMFKVLTHQDENTETYTIQYSLKNLEDYYTYQKNHAPALQKETSLKFGDKVIGFRSLLEEV